MGVGDGFRNDSGLGFVRLPVYQNHDQNPEFRPELYSVLNSLSHRYTYTIRSCADRRSMHGSRDAVVHKAQANGCTDMIFDFLSHWIRPPLELLGAKPARSACSCRPFQIHVAAHRRQAYQIHARRMRLMERCSHQIPCGRRHRMKDDRAS